MAEPPRVIVAIDFGTTFSGFAFALVSDPKNIYPNYDWTDAPVPYAKTKTVLAYNLAENCGRNKRRRDPELASWGWPAFLAHKERLATGNARYTGASAAGGNSGYGFCERFKLYLSHQHRGGQIPALPEGVTVQSAIADYLRALGKKNVSTEEPVS